MTEKEQADVLLALWQGTASRRQNRQTYEWKIAFGVWAGEVAALGFILSRSTSLDLWRWFSWPYLGAGLVLAVFHGLFVVCFIRPRNHDDLRTAIGYERAIRKLLGDDDLPELPDTPKLVFATHGFEMGMTIFLALVGPFTLHRW